MLMRILDAAFVPQRRECCCGMAGGASASASASAYQLLTLESRVSTIERAMAKAAPPPPGVTQGARSVTRPGDGDPYPERDRYREHRPQECIEEMLTLLELAVDAAR